ncbi:hypothetical protein [Candidatus Clostridium radicumherbarum]|uniref:Uncharacterized protein n=1 Tax=Candidatus Clostridium radicumherbarum TaxID=3381662 RepID=A0ABW8TQ53_9CLOT
MEKSAELKIQINDYLMENLKKESFKQSLSKHMSMEFKKIIIDNKKELIQSTAYKNIKSKFKEELLNTIKSQNFKNQISILIDNNLSALEKSNKTLEKTIPPAVINSLKVYIYNHKDDLISGFKKILSSKEIEKRIYAEINNVINGMGPMVSRFINVNNIYSKLKISIEDYLNEPKNVLEIINFINKEIDKIMKKKISEFSTYFPVEGRNAIINSLTNALSENIAKPSFIDMILNLIDEKLEIEICNMSLSDLNLIDELTTNFINNNYDILLINSEIKIIINNISEGIVDNFLSKPIMDLI